MTLINTIRRSDRVVVMSDGAGLDENACVATIATKVLAMPLIRSVVGIRGDYLIATLLNASLAADARKFGSYDGLKAGLIQYLRDTFKTCGPQWKKLRGRNCLEMDVIVGGISVFGPHSFLVRTMEKTPTPAWQIIDPGPVLLTPSNSEIFAEVDSRLADQDGVICDSYLVEVAEKQRLHREPYGPKKIRTSFVGGFLQVTEVSAREIKTRIVHRWQDEIGKRLALRRGAAGPARDARL